MLPVKYLKQKQEIQFPENTSQVWAAVDKTKRIKLWQVQQAAIHYHFQLQTHGQDYQSQPEI